jgi:hypothetical protein
VVIERKKARDSRYGKVARFTAVNVEHYRLRFGSP